MGNDYYYCLTCQYGDIHGYTEFNSSLIGEHEAKDYCTDRVCRYGHGATGSLGDGCNDCEEITLNVCYLIIFVTAFLNLIKSKQALCSVIIPRCVGMIVVMTSLYHLLFGEMTREAYHDDAEFTTVPEFLYTFNTRDTAVPITMGVLAALLTISQCSCCACFCEPCRRKKPKRLRSHR